jgi:hypothetical protein
MGSKSQRASGARARHSPAGRGWTGRHRLQPEAAKMGQGPCLQPALPPRPRRSLCDGGAAQGAIDEEMGDGGQLTATAATG